LNQQQHTMKTKYLLLLVCAATVLGTHAAEPASNPPVVALCFVAAADALTAVQQKLGANAAEAVSGVDEKRNTVTLNSTHSQAAIVRAFLTGLDHRPPEIRVDATITRYREATSSSPAREEVLSRRVILPQGARPEAFRIPEEQGSTRIELRATQLSQ
jgi:hypothetical protein